MIRTLGLALCLGLLLSTWACGADVVERQKAALNTQQLEEMTEGYLDGVTVDTDSDLQSGLAAIWEKGIGQLADIFRRATRSGGLLLVIVLLCAVADTLREMGSGGGPDIVPVAGALAVTAASATNVSSLISIGKETIDQLDAFSKVLLPTITAAASAGGMITSSAARQTATLLFADVLITLINRLLIPLIYAYIAASTAYAAVGNESLKGIADLVKWVVTSVLTVIMIAFVSYLTLSGVLAGSADALTVKAARFAISGMVPVVGGILSDAAESVLAGAGLLRNAIGLFGVLGILAFCIVPFLQLGVHYLIYKAAAVLSSTMARGRIGGLIGSIGGAFGLMLGMTGACALLMLVSLISAITMVTV